MTSLFVRMANYYLFKGTFPMANTHKNNKYGRIAKVADGGPMSLVIQGDKVQTWTLNSTRECVRMVETVLGCELKAWGRLALEAFASVNVGGYMVTIERAE